MSVILKFKIGGTVVEVRGEHEEDAWKQASFWNELPTCCGLCQSTKIGLRYRTTKDYDFYELQCRECKATFAVGQKKEGGLYPRGSKEKGHEGEWEVEYQGGGGRNDRDDDRGGRDDRRDSRQDDRGGDRGGRSSAPRDDRRQDQRGGREDDRRERQQQERKAEPARGRQQPPPDDDDSDIPF